MISLKVSIAKQTLCVFENDELRKTYLVSTGKNGAGELNGSGKTPRGLHIIRAKIGENAAANTVFVGRRPTGEIYSHSLRESSPDRDWMLTRIMWLSGKEVGKNRLGDVDTMRRYIYIHGTPDDVIMGVPGSKGCIRMRNSDIIELFDQIPVGSSIFIE